MRAAAWPPYGPPAPQGDGRSMLLPYTRPALPAWYTCGRMYRYTVPALRRRGGTRRETAAGRRDRQEGDGPVRLRVPIMAR